MTVVGQTETNWHVRATSGFTPITDINLGQIARQASSAARPNGPHLTAFARCNGRPPHARTQIDRAVGKAYLCLYRL